MKKGTGTSPSFTPHDASGWWKNTEGQEGFAHDYEGLGIKGEDRV